VGTNLAQNVSILAQGGALPKFQCVENQQLSVRQNAPTDSARIRVSLWVPLDPLFLLSFSQKTLTWEPNGHQNGQITY